MEGVIRTRVGYAGGKAPNPTYRNIQDYSETIQIEYDPSVISYETLIQVFWDSHNPTARAWSRQYMSIVFVHDEEQERVARETKQRTEEQAGRPVMTEIQPYETFYSAEDYHQKYYLQNRRDIFDALKRRYVDFDAFIDSTTAARLNGFVAGHGTQEQVEAALEALQLEESIDRQLRRMTGAVL
jgi:peptide-methionine (S)-S-oxide reductase